MAKSPESPNPTPPERTPEGGSSRAEESPSRASPTETRGASASSPQSSAEGSAGSASGSAATSRGRTISSRKGQYLIAPRKPTGMQLMGLQPLLFSVVEQTLRSSPDIEIVDTVGPKNIMSALADGMSDMPSVLVAKMTDQKAATLHQQAQGRLIVEVDRHLHLLDPAFQRPMLVAGAIPTSGPVLTTVIIVVGKDNMPLPDAEVYLFGSLLPGNGVTDAQGRVTLTMFGETADSIHSLYVKPKADYWSFYQHHPDLSTDEANIVGVRPLSDWPALANFPQQQVYGWGQRAMRLDQLPGNYRGQGIKIAVIDSGAATTHQDLNKISFGFDVINKKNSPDTWNEDTVAHGSHCAGVIAGSDNPTGIRGFAPGSEVHVCKLFPGGQISQLIDALEYCIEKQIDVVNLSLGGIEPSEALEQQILRAKRLGIACIVAAGNSGNAVQYPGSSPNVLAVAAIGKLNEFPSDSYHAQTLTQFIDADGFFSAKFTCFGPQIGVCAPGVAITSSVPKNNYAVWDGTSMAAPHITGLAALVLAHHPEFQTAFRARNSERVERLFQIIKASSRRLNLGDPSRTGFGLPDVLVAVGLQSQIGVPMSQTIGAAAAPKTLMSNAMLGALGGRLGQHVGYGGGGMNQPGYAEQHAQMMPQQWFGDPSGQIGQSLGAQMLSSGIDPAYANYMQNLLTQQQIGGIPGFPFGLSPPPFGRAIW